MKKNNFIEIIYIMIKYKCSYKQAKALYKIYKYFKN